MKILIILAVVATLASALTPLQQQVTNELNTLLADAKANSSIAIKKVSDAAAVVINQLYVRASQNQASFTAEVNVFPFAKLTATTKTALKKVTDTISSYMTSAVSSVAPDSYTLNIIINVAPDGSRMQTAVESWFQNSFGMNVNMVVLRVGEAPDSCIQQYQSTIVPNLRSISDLVLNSMDPNAVPAHYQASFDQLAATETNTANFITVLKGCAAASTNSAVDTCIKNFLAQNVNCADCTSGGGFAGGFAGPYTVAMNTYDVSGSFATSQGNMLLMGNTTPNDLYVCTGPI